MGFRVKLFNSEDPGAVLAIVEGPNAATWAKDEQGTIGGSRWEADGSDFAYTVLENHVGLAAELRGEGYDLDESEFVEEDETVREEAEEG